MLRTVKAGALIGAAALALAACSSGGTDGSTASSTASGGTGHAAKLTIGAVVDVSTWAAQDSSWGNAATYYMAVYDTLVRAAADGTIEPALATDWSYDDSMTVLTLNLRDDVTFTDGSALDSQVVVDNLTRFQTGASENSGNLASIADVTAVDSDTVQITLSAPDPSLLDYLSQNSGLIEAESAFTADDIQTVPVGSGPYILDSAASTIGSTYTFTANPDYWDPESQHYDTVVINYYADANALTNALRDGQVDIANLNSTSQIPDAESAGYTVNTQTLNWKGLILADRWGVVDPALADVRVRQAINYALDREGLLQGLESGYGEVTDQIFGTGTTAYDASLEDYYTYDVDKAKQLLTEAGYPDGITITMPLSGFVPEAEAQLIAGNLADAGITVSYEQAGESFISDLLGGKWGVFEFGLNQEAVSWSTYKLAVAPDSAWNIYHQTDDTLQALADRMRLGGEDGDAAAQEMNQYLVENAWFAPFYRYVNAVVTTDGTAVTLKNGQAAPNLWDIVPTA
ncbi:ABC transporter substrate-binding protein [Demequina capsici]|uniref:ABC transporter substrate-binding protein n=1 Tax=Demequina capsici TaxID=3075620 RepID=A0AA96J782_9MICO|nr:ABC transporter substrate-binding protein [Demequina sp. OYTSA14]WNM23773.1 ABC transporter substrate-binding protein [Demequina sp. OYTSA14]